MKTLMCVLLMASVQFVFSQSQEDYSKGAKIAIGVDGVEYPGKANHYNYDLGRRDGSVGKKPELSSDLNKADKRYVLLHKGSAKFQLLVISERGARLFCDFNAKHPDTRIVDVLFKDGEYFALYANPQGFEVYRFSGDSGKASIVMSAFISVDPRWIKSTYNRKSPLITSVEIDGLNAFTIKFDHGEVTKVTFINGEDFARRNGEPKWPAVRWYGEE